MPSTPSFQLIPQAATQGWSTTISKPPEATG